MLEADRALSALPLESPVKSLAGISRAVRRNRSHGRIWIKHRSAAEVTMDRKLRAVFSHRSDPLESLEPSRRARGPEGCARRRPARRLPPTTNGVLGGRTVYVALSARTEVRISEGSVT